MQLVREAETAATIRPSARSYAELGETTASERAVGRAEGHFAAVDPGAALPWTEYMGTAEFTAQRGHAWYLLSATQPDAAVRAVPLLAAATGALGDDYARTRAVNLAGLAGSHARAGDIDDCLAVHQTADVADLRHDIQTACTAS
ncbi:MAG: hypothetical protein LC799_06135 [Actinobacteria bacterium]|nr:hypothetical protein [Actinomycetota bacterium]